MKVIGNVIAEASQMLASEAYHKGYAIKTEDYNGTNNTLGFELRFSHGGKIWLDEDTFNKYYKSVERECDELDKASDK